MEELKDNTMNLKGRKLRPISLIAAILILAFCAAFFLPEIASIYWHMRFGSSTTFHGWRVVVPGGWWAFTREDLLIIQKSVRFYDGADAPTISVELYSPGKAVDPDALKQGSIQAISKKGYAFQEDRPIQIGTDRGYCLHFSTGADRKKARISCYFPATHLSFDLFGRNSDIQDFYSVVGRVSQP